MNHEKQHNYLGLLVGKTPTVQLKLVFINIHPDTHYFNNANSWHDLCGIRVKSFNLPCLKCHI